MKKINIINACSDLGVHINGSNLGPDLISKELTNNKINKILTLNKNDIKKSYDKNDLRKNLDAVNELNKRIYENIVLCKKSNFFPITIGGDHSVVIGSALGSINNENLGIIWIDAHADYNTFETTITGNIHGLPLAAITGYHNEELRDFLTKKHINYNNTVIIGARSIDKEELNNLKNVGITIFSTNDLKENSIDNIMCKAFEIASSNTNGVHVSYDLDIIDPLVCPGVSVAEENGITEEDAFKIMDSLIKFKDLIKSFDLVEYNPLLDIDNKTKIIAVNLLKEFIQNI